MNENKKKIKIKFNDWNDDLNDFGLGEYYRNWETIMRDQSLRSLARYCELFLELFDNHIY